MFSPIFISEGLRMYRRRLRVAGRGFNQYKGDAEEICEAIIEDCWNGDYFQTSAGHFCEFWTRDFSWCAEALINLGHEERVKKTLEYAMGVFKRHGGVATTISPRGRVFDFPMFAPDSLPCFLKCLNMLKDKSLIKSNKEFLNSEVKRYEGKVFDRDKGRVKKGVPFSSIKDHAKRSSSCYNNVMIGMLADGIRKAGLYDLFKEYNFKKIIKKKFWNGSYFYEDINKDNIVTGDSNVFPFWAGIFDKGDMMKKVFETVEKAGLSKPFPLKYSDKRYKRQRMRGYRVFAKDYERTAIWAHIGLIYTSLMKGLNKGRYEYFIRRYRQNIEKYRTFLELYDSGGKPYKSAFYISDEGMLWSSIFLDMVRKE